MDSERGSNGTKLGGSDAQPTVSIVIPVLDAEPFLPGLFAALLAQKPAPPLEIILVDSNSSDGTRVAAAACPIAKVVPIDDFSHGRSRNLGGAHASGEIVAFLSQDALPANDSWLAALVAPFNDPTIAATYSRQIPRGDAMPMECFFLLSRFPPGESVRRSAAAGEPLSLEKVFFSNVSSAVRRDALARHPFDETLIMSEDQQLSRDLIAAGYAVVYQPSSVVVHSHRYTLANVFRRYFDSVYSLQGIFSDHTVGTSASMGLRYLARETRFIVRHHPLWLPYFFLYTATKTAATLAGHLADRLPGWLLRRISLHSYHWRPPG
jgi:rhamnosyltransferase